MPDISTAPVPDESSLLTAIPEPAAPAPAVCPIPLSVFPPNLARSFDPKSPTPVRGMAAKGLIPGSPRDILTGLFVLSFDPDPKIVETARATAMKVNDKVHSTLRDEALHPAVLAFYAEVLKDADTYLEFICLNQSTTDETIAYLGATADEKVAEIVAQNQLRFLRDDRIVRALVGNPRARPSTKDNVLDFCVRSGVVLMDMPEYLEARRRVLGIEPALVQKLVEAEAVTADKVLAEAGGLLSDEAVEDVGDEKRLTFTQKVMKMSVSQKIKLATLGNKEARTMLLRDSNKLVCMAAITSPRMTESEVVALSKNRTLHDDVMRYISSNRQWLKNYQIKVNLVNNPKCHVGISMKLLPHLHPSEVKEVARNKNIAATLQTMARQSLQKKEQPQGGGGH